MNKSWKVTLEKADDNSEDLILPLTEEMLEASGFAVGDTLEWIAQKDGSWILRKKVS